TPRRVRHKPSHSVASHSDYCELSCMQLCSELLVALSYFLHKNFCRSMAWPIVCRNNTRCVLGHITSCFLRSFLHNTTSETSNVHILSANHCIFYYFKKRFYCFLNIHFL